jgi:hypothetical protein
MISTRTFAGCFAIFCGVTAALFAFDHAPCRADDSPAVKAPTASFAEKKAAKSEFRWIEYQLVHRGVFARRDNKWYYCAVERSCALDVDLRPFLSAWGLEPRLQLSRNTCSVFVIAECIEYALATQQKHGTRLSVEYLNWTANEKSREYEDGSNFEDLLAGYKAFGVCPEADMPYQEKFDPAQKPSPEAISHAKTFGSLNLNLHWIKEWDDQKGVDAKQLAEIKRLLDRHWPVCGGFLWPKCKKIDNRILSVVPRAGVIDGHSVLLVGYRDDPSQPGGGVFLFRNTAGNFRDSLMTYQYAMTYMNDAVWIDYEGADEGGIPATEAK